MDIVESYKGFNKDMTCTPPNTDIKFQYEEGEEYETKTAECGENGFHAYEMPLDVFKFYPPTKSVYHIVEQSGDIDRKDTKIASTKIKIGAEISIAGLIKAHFDVVKKKIDKAIKEDGNSETGRDYSNIAGGYGSNIAGGYYSNLAGGDCSNLAGGNDSNIAGGYYSNIAGGDGSNIAGGDCSNIAGRDGSNIAGGDYSNIAGRNDSNIAGGYYSNIAGGNGSNLAGGDYSNIAGRGSCSVGSNGVAVVRGKKVKAKGGIGSVIVIIEECKNNSDIRFWKAFVIDGETYKPDTFYMIKDGEIVEC